MSFRGAKLALSALGVALFAFDAWASSTASLEGRRIADLLRDAQRDGIRVVFTDQLVPPDLRATAQPKSHDTVTQLREVLRAHSLDLDEISTGLYAVTRERVATKPSTPVASAADPLVEVEVTASRYTIDSLSVRDSLSVVGANIQRQPALFNDAARTLRQFPGTAGADISSRTFVRGGLPEDNLILLDGVPIEQPWHLQSLPINTSIIDPTTIGRLDFYSGVLPAEYGNRMGALVDMRLQEPTETFSGRLAVGSLDVSAYASGSLPADQGDWLFFARNGLLGRVQYPDYRWDIGHPALNDILARVRKRFDDGSVLSFGTLIARDDADVVLRGGDVFFDDRAERTYAWTAYETNSERLSSRTTVSYTELRTDRIEMLGEVLESSGGLNDFRRLHSLHAQQHWTLPLDERMTLRWGGALREEQARFDYSRVLIFQQDVADFFQRPARADTFIGASVALHERELYGAVNRRIGDRLKLDAGFHWSGVRYSQGGTHFGWDPRLSLRFDLSDATRFRFSTGRMTQIFSALELPVEQGRVDSDSPSVSTQHVLGFEHDFGSRVAVRAELFERHIHDPRPRFENLFYPNAFLAELRPDYLLIEPESSRMRGADLYVTAMLSKRVSAWLSYSHTRATDVINGERFARSWDQPHAVGLGLTAEGHSWLLSGAVYGHSDWPRTPLLSVPPDANSPSTEIVNSIGRRNSVRDGRYLSLDLKAAYRVRFASGSLYFGLEASNATNRNNVCCEELVFFRLPFENGSVGERGDRRYWLPVRPYATIAWEFGQPGGRRSGQ